MNIFGSSYEQLLSLTTNLDNRDAPVQSSIRNLNHTISTLEQIITLTKDCQLKGTTSVRILPDIHQSLLELSSAELSLQNLLGACPTLRALIKHPSLPRKDLLLCSQYFFSVEATPLSDDARRSLLSVAGLKQLSTLRAICQKHLTY